MAQNVLILFAHPAASQSRANKVLRRSVQGLDHVTIHDLYETWPDLLIDPAAEQDLLMAHHHIVWMHPFYWYSAPSLVKEWLDMVLEYGWAYGEGGTQMAGKTWTQAITTGATGAAYRPDGLNGFTIEELLRPFEATARLCHCIWQEPFVVHSSRQMSDDALVEAGFAFRDRIEGLIHG